MTVDCDCGRPVGDAYVCGQCAAELSADLGDVPALVDELGIMLARMATFGEKASGRAGGAVLPYDARASEASYVLRNTLASTVRLVAAERGIPEPVAVVRAIPRTPEGYGIPQQGPGRHRGPQRCDLTDLPTEACHHCREANR